jgi:uncharacterized protein (TIGR00730 family)
MNTICVYAGSNLGVRPEFKTHTRKLGEEIAKRGLALVYGGSGMGLMGELANEVLENGGKVIGVMPTGLFAGELMHQGLTEFIEVKDMHERKAKMIQLSDGYIALPGGFGTFEELFEVISWAQLGIHKKPIGIFNVEGYYTPLLEMIHHSIQAGFVKESHKALFLSADEAGTLMDKMVSFIPPELGKKWDQI